MFVDVPVSAEHLEANQQNKKLKKKNSNHV
jgi:hypothetical protein